MERQPQITQLLKEWSTGESDSLEQIIPAVYDELHKVARSYMRDLPQDHTLQTTALINEAFLRIGNIKTELRDRGHFVGIVANVMRQVLVDHARAKYSQKRGGGVRAESIDDVVVASPEPSTDILALEKVLKQLEKRDPRKVRIAELYYFCGGTYAETAAALGISEATLHRELRLLKAFLGRQFKDEKSDQ